MRDFCVYIHIFPNGKVYIGQTKQKPEDRWSKGKGYRGQLVGRAIQKYGWSNIVHKVIKTNLSKDEANELEISLIKHYDSTNEHHGYNIAFGGCANAKGLKHTAEHNQKISDSHKKRVCCYTREGNKVGTFESIMTASDFVGGSFRVISACCNGKKKSGYGYIWRFENDSFNKFDTVNKVGGVKGYPVVAYTINGDYLGTYKSAKEASQDLGVREDVISQVCRKMRANKNGLVFKYLTEVDDGESEESSSLLHDEEPVPGSDPVDQVAAG